MNSIEGIFASVIIISLVAGGLGLLVYEYQDVYGVTDVSTINNLSQFNKYNQTNARVQTVANSIVNITKDPASTDTLEALWAAGFNVVLLLPDMTSAVIDYISLGLGSIPMGSMFFLLYGSLFTLFTIFLFIGVLIGIVLKLT